MKKFLCYSLLLLLPFVGIAQSIDQIIKQRPNPPRLVTDLAGVLDAQQLQALESKLVAYDDSTSNQIAIVLVKTLDGYPIEEAAVRLFREWGVGNKATNNGILILASIDERQVRIETGYGLEGAVPDITASQIIRNDIGPSFREGNYFEGLDSATNSIMLAAAGEYKAPEGYNDRAKGKRFPFGTILFIIILIIFFSRGRGGGGGGFMSRRGYRRGLGPLIFFPPIGGGGWGGGGGGGWSGGGGGFGGFGGGSSGGGGASGSW
jgi:uncharacterized protein